MFNLNYSVFLKIKIPKQLLVEILALLNCAVGIPTALNEHGCALHALCCCLGLESAVSLPDILFTSGKVSPQEFLN